jgi:tRNA-specific 2-thiouridylase
MNKKKRKVVFVAMSGGVDSSVAAVLLKERGFAVVGVFMKNWSYIPQNNAETNAEQRGKDSSASQRQIPRQSALSPRSSAVECGWEEDQRSARMAASKIGIPLYTWDFEEGYKNLVVDYMIREYARGLTPNPDVMCNKTIKFGLFLQKAMKLGADYIATGHYARISLTNNESRTNKPINEFENSQQIRYSLMVGTDPNKDQSYFLWTLTQEQLKYCLFPIGDYTKPQVREIARKFDLPNAERKDSQGLCFVGKVDFRQFMRDFLPEKPGLIVDTTGNVIGKHPGLQFFTIGQRHGLGICGSKEPYFVVAKDANTNTLYVAQAEDNPALYNKEVLGNESNWISGKEPKFPIRCKARIRYRQSLQWCTVDQLSVSLRSPVNSSDELIKPTTDNRQLITVIFDQPQRAVAPGQSIVFYQGEHVLGGGVIESAVAGEYISQEKISQAARVT